MSFHVRTLFWLLQVRHVVSRLRTLHDNHAEVFTDSPTLAPTLLLPHEIHTPQGRTFLAHWGPFLVLFVFFVAFLFVHYMHLFRYCCALESEDMATSPRDQLFPLTLHERTKLLARIFPKSVRWRPDTKRLTSSETPAEDSPTDILQDDRMCCICLVPYKPGVHILKGTTCQHTFHYSCCMEWLKKHDECPYCRRELFTAAEWRAAAIQVLGQARVQAIESSSPVAQIASTVSIHDNAETTPVSESIQSLRN